jgi:hypothetical protein
LPHHRCQFSTEDKIMGSLRLLRYLSMLCLAAGCALARADSLAAPAFSITGSSSGSLAQLSVGASLQVAPADVGQNGVIYVAAAVYGAWAFQSAGGGWSLWTGGPLPEPYFRGVLGAHTLTIVSGLDLRSLPDVKFLVGYGLDANDMIAGQKYQLIAAAPTGSLVGTWLATSVSGGNFSLGQALVISADGRYINIDDCYSAGNYTLSGDIASASVLEFRANSDGNNCANPRYPVGSSMQMQFSASGDSLATYMNGGRAVWQRLPPPSGPPIGSWVLTSVSGGDAFSPGDSISINADGSFTLIGNLTNTGGCTTTGTYAIDGNLFTLVPQRSTLPSKGGSCQNPPTPGLAIVSAFTVSGNQLTFWHAGLVGIGKLVAY